MTRNQESYRTSHARRWKRGELSVLIVEDHALVRAGLRALLAEMGVEVIAETADAGEVMPMFEQHVPDVVLMDVLLGPANGLDVTRQLIERDPDAKILVISVHNDPEYMRRAFDAGARGYIVKNARPEDFERALRIVATGGYYRGTAPVRSVGRALSPFADIPQELATLTPRQLEVFQLMADGNSTRDIADLMGVSVKTVETHRALLMKRLGIHDVAGLVRLAIRTGVVKLDA